MLAKGDQLQLKANAPSLDGKELINGELVTVAGVNSKGQIQLKDGRTLPENYREFTRGYAITSYGSQGKTVEHVLFFGFIRKGRDKQSAMAGHDFTRNAGGQNLHPGQSAVARERRSLGRPRIGD